MTLLYQLVYGSSPDLVLLFMFQNTTFLVLTPKVYSACTCVSLPKEVCRPTGTRRFFLGQFRLSEPCVKFSGESLILSGITSLVEL